LTFIVYSIDIVVNQIVNKFTTNRNKEVVPPGLSVACVWNLSCLTFSVHSNQS